MKKKGVINIGSHSYLYVLDLSGKPLRFIDQSEQKDSS